MSRKGKILKTRLRNQELRAIQLYKCTTTRCHSRKENICKIKNIVSIKNFEEHDVLLTARKNHPAVFVDGMFLDGIERVEFINHFENKDCEVLLTFNDRIENNPFPLDEG